MKLAELFGTEIDFHTDLARRSIQRSFPVNGEGGVDISTVILATQSSHQPEKDAVCSSE